MGQLQKIQTYTNSEELVYHWYKPYYWPGGIFIVIWDIINVLLWSPLVRQLWVSETSLYNYLFAVVSFLFLILIPTYWTALCLLNKTKVELSPSAVTVTNGPLPSSFGNWSVATKQIKYILIEEPLLKRGCGKHWHVKAIMKNGSSCYIFLNIENLEDARNFRTRIEGWLQQNRREETAENLLTKHKINGGTKGKVGVRRGDNEI